MNAKSGKEVQAGGSGVGMRNELLCLIPDMLTARVFDGTGMLQSLFRQSSGYFRIVPLADQFDARSWGDTLQSACLAPLDPFVWPSGIVERIRFRVDKWFDARFGFFPLAIRFNLKNGFLSERMAAGSENWFLDTNRVGLLPRTDACYRLMFRWMFSRYRFVPRRLEQYFRDHVKCLFVGNIQRERITPFLAAAVRTRTPVVGYIASWDHPVGKGVVFPHCVRYIVQNTIMADALVRYHGIEASRIVVTGWPQVDNLIRVRNRDSYERELEQHKLASNRPCILFAGNTERNSPYEPVLLRRLLAWWTDRGGASWASLVYRPHPKHTDWRKRHPEIAEQPGFHIQDTSYHDHEIQATYLQHVDCVVTNAGTILLEAIACDRPCVCYLFDESCQPDEGPYAAKNITGPHYEELKNSGAYWSAHSFNELVDGIERSVYNPDEHRQARKEISRLLLGDLDGCATGRVVQAVIDAKESLHD